MKGSFIFSEKSGSMNLQSWIKKASKEERIEMARKIASTVEKSDDEISYFDTANLEKMPKEERTCLGLEQRQKINRIEFIKFRQDLQD